MHNSTDLWHIINSQPIWELSDISSGLINTRISDISWEITWILDVELQCIVRDNNEHLNSLLEKLRIEVLRISDVIWYDYQNQHNYLYNLLQPNSTIIKALESLFSNYPELKYYYNSILDLFPDNNFHALIKDKLYSDYLENLIVESMPQVNLIDYEIYSLIDEKIKGNNFVGFNSRFIHKYNVNWCSAISLHKTILKRFFEDSKHDIINFSHNVRYCKYLWLTDTHLEQLSIEELELLSSHFYNLKIISLSPDDICKMSYEQLLILFRNLNSIKYLEITAWVLNNPEVLENILSILSWIKRVNIWKIICKFGFWFNNFSQDCKDVMNKYTTNIEFK